MLAGWHPNIYVFASFIAVVSVLSRSSLVGGSDDEVAMVDLFPRSPTSLSKGYGDFVMTFFPC